MISVIFTKNGETVMLRPEEISKDCTIAESVNSKTNVKLYIYPTFEAWGFCKQTITYVRIYDDNELTFRGRVVGITAEVDSRRIAVQEITCAGSLDFLEDSASYIISGGKTVSAALEWVLNYHNDCVGVNDPRRLLKGTTGTGTFYGETQRGSSYAQLAEMLSKGIEVNDVPGCKFEMSERYDGEDTYIDINEAPGEKKSTALIIGENLQSITVERGINEGIVNSIIATSGKCVDGNEIYYTASDAASIAQYGKYEKRMKNETIYSSKPHYDYTYVNGEWVYGVSPVWQLAYNALAAWAELQLQKANNPYIQIKLTAFDLAKMGLSDYDDFELGNTYPVICPQLDLCEEMRITGIERSLARGEIVSITIEKGEKLNELAEANLSKLIAVLGTMNAIKQEENETRQNDMTDAKLYEVNTDWTVREMTQQQFDDLPSNHNWKTHGICIIRNQPGDDAKLYVGGTHIDSGGGGDRGTIENAVVLTSEQGTEWAPDHELTPVWFRGTASVYYGQSPARFVAQGQRVLHGVVDANIVADDIISEFDLELSTGAIKRYRLVITAIEYYSNVTRFYPYCYVYDVTGGSETYEGRYGNDRGYGVIDVPVANATWKIGVVLRCSSWGTINGMLSPNLSMRIYGWGDVSGVLSNQYLKSFSPPYNPIPVSQAESDFGVTITTKTEPVAPSSGGGA